MRSRHPRCSRSLMLCKIFLKFFLTLLMYSYHFLAPLRAGGDNSIIREREYNSRAPLSSSDSEDDGDDEKSTQAPTPAKKRRLKRSNSKESEISDSESSGKFLQQAADAIAKKARTTDSVRKSSRRRNSSWLESGIGERLRSRLSGVS